MNKIKVVSKAGLLQLVIKSRKGQQISEHEANIMTANQVSGLLPVDIVQKGFSFKLVYDISGMVSLREYLTIPMNKLLFAKILQNILFDLHAVEQAYFNQQNILLEIDHVMVDPTTSDIYFVYAPIQFYENSNSLRDFLLSIIQHCTFDANEDNHYVKEYITILNSGVAFSRFELEEYINKLHGQASSYAEETKCPHCQSKLGKGTHYCSACGAKVLSTLVSAKQSTYNPLNSQDTFAEDAHCLPAASTSRAHYGVDAEETTIGTNEPYVYSPVYLIREKTNEKIEITTASFRIGTQKKCVDYWINDNNTVSRCHADIIRRGHGIYIVDLHSTNKTYVNGSIIPPEKEVELFSGTRVRLSNENFIVETDSTVCE